jgi:hypothetical protein
MPRIARRVVLAAILVVFAAALAGCGSGTDEGGPASWERVVTAKVSGDAPVKLNLGTHQLGSKARLEWKLSGPAAPPVTLTFRLINADYGTGFGYSMTPQSQGFKLETANAMTIGPIKPGNFTVYFSQRFPLEEGPGFDGQITVYTLK